MKTTRTIEHKTKKKNSNESCEQQEMKKKFESYVDGDGSMAEHLSELRDCACGAKSGECASVAEPPNAIGGNRGQDRHNELERHIEQHVDSRKPEEFPLAVGGGGPRIREIIDDVADDHAKIETQLESEQSKERSSRFVSNLNKKS